MRFRALVLFATMFGAVSLASCSESLDGGGACPLLCPQEAVPILDTLIDAVTLDTSIAGFPAIGFETSLLLAKRGDTLDTRIITRFDSMPTEFVTRTGTGALNRLDSAYLRGILPLVDSLRVFGDDAVIEAFDVTSAVDDTAAASLAAEFVPANLIGSQAFSAGESPDTVTILLDTARVRDRVANGQSIRIGLRMVTAGSASIRFISQQAGIGMTLFLHPDRDTTLVSIFPAKSNTPDIARLRPLFGDFTIAVTGSIPPGDVLRVGGFPGRRVLLRFNIPAHIVDSSVVIRATLMMTQASAKTAAAGDTAIVRITPIIVSSQVTNLYEMLQFAGSPQEFPVDTLIVFPKDSARREFQIVNLVRNWRGQDTVKTPRVVALTMKSEGEGAAGVDFFSTEAPAAVRPRLRITYITRVPSGRP